MKSFTFFYATIIFISPWAIICPTYWWASTVVIWITVTVPKTTWIGFGTATIVYAVTTQTYNVLTVASTTGNKPYLSTEKYIYGKKL